MTKDHSQPTDQSQHGEALASAFGRQLTAAREASDQSVSAIAEQLCITTSIIARLESGCWASAGPDVYVRGYVTAYCRLLDLDAAEAIEYFRQRESERVASDSLEAMSRQRHPGFAQYQRVVAYGAATLLIGPALIFWVAQGFRGGEVQINTSPQEQLVQNPASLVQEPAEQRSDTSKVAVEQPVMASMATVPETLPRETEVGLLPGQTPEPATEPEADSQQGDGLLELEFLEDVWLEVSASGGERLGYGLMSASSARSFPIAQGLSVRLGNANSVVAKVDGVVLDLLPYIKQDVASFTLPVRNTDQDQRESSMDQ